MKAELINLLQNPDQRDKSGIKFFFSKDNIMPNGDLISFLYGAKKYHDYLEDKIEGMITISENALKTNKK
jgi:hypothetical protein